MVNRGDVRKKRFWMTSRFVNGQPWRCQEENVSEWHLDLLMVSRGDVKKRTLLNDILIVIGQPWRSQEENATEWHLDC